MSGVPNQGHFYCSASRIDGRWFICERRCKKHRIYGGYIGSCKSRYFAYELRNVLEKMYRLGAYDKLTRWRFVFAARYLWEDDVYYEALFFARDLLREVNGG